MPGTDFFSKEYYINREMSWLEFNQRVLDEAADAKNPLLERLKFLAIVSSNLDEFFMVRVGSLHDQINAGFNRADSAGLTPKMQLVKISRRVQKMMNDVYSLWNADLVPALENRGIRILKPAGLSQSQSAYLADYFDSIIYPVLTPMAVDSSRPFPLIQNKTLNIAVLVENGEEGEDDVFSTVQVPSVFARMVALPGQSGGREFILLEDVIAMHIDRLFAGKRIKETCTYRVTRNGDLAIDEDEAEDLLLEIEKSLKQRRWGQAVLLELEAGAGQTLMKVLSEKLEIQEGYVSLIDGPLDLTFLFALHGEEGLDDLKYEPYAPQIPADLVGKGDIFKAIRENDILLHHPYESFDPIVEMIEQAAADPRVLAIKQTLYRVSGKSPIIRALAEAADRGKQVTVLVELKARFDEENNIHWAKSLEKAGCHVIYGLVGLKTHCKITLIVRMEDEGINRYVHLSTGNYNDETARIYTDIGLLTCNKYIAEDASTVFNALTGFSERPRLNKLVIAPTHLRSRFSFLIEREIQNARAGRQAYIKAKLNSLVDTDIIGLLYEASCAGVKIELIVRGMCCLKPGIKGVSENIEIRSIVGRYLEHSRIYCFCNGGNEDVYISSADWMERNLDRRVELLIPIEDERTRRRVRHILDIYLKDNVKARQQKPDGLYSLRGAEDGAQKVNAQDYFMEEAISSAACKAAMKDEGVFKPRANPAQT
jgi:polyphosphate kinase